MRIIALSDFHGVFPQNLPEHDLTLIAGDISPFSIQGQKNMMKEWIEGPFALWVSQLSTEKVVMVPGNHDYYLEGMTSNKKILFEANFFGKLKCLWNEYYTVEIDGFEPVEIFGTPLCHIYGSWPFMRIESVLREKFSIFDKKVDIFLTHDPVQFLGTTDCVLEPKYTSQDPSEHVGDPVKHEQIMKLYDENKSPRLVISGHIHSGNHTPEIHLNSMCANVSLMDEHCKALVYKPLNLLMTPDTIEVLE